MTMSEPDSDKNLRRLNFLNQHITISKSGTLHTGTVFYYCDKCIILAKEGGVFEMLNLENFDKAAIEVKEEEGHDGGLQESLNEELVTAERILSKILE